MGFLRGLGVALGIIGGQPAPPDTGLADGEHLYHMTHIDNLSSIMSYGLLSHNRAHRDRAVTDISDRNVNERRAQFSIGGKPLHDYVPLYFNPKNPMLYRRREIQDDIAILAVSRQALFWRGVWFTDGNAASNDTEFYNDLNDLSRLDWNCIWDEYWNHHYDGTRKRCAEVLVSNVIYPQWIEAIIVRDTAARAAVLRRVRADIPVVIQPWRYF